MSEDQSSVVTLKVRVTPEFREKIVATAKENNRSMNQEIVSRLEQSFEESFDKDQQLIFLKEMNDARAKDIDKLIRMVEQLLSEKKAP